MKKISAVILAITAVTMISCQRETIDSGALTGEVEFTVTAGIPGGISTYADPVAAFSHNGGAVNVDPDKYDLRYILEVYTKDQTPVRVYRKTVIVPDNFTTTDVTITARLVAKTYDFVFWADFVENGSAENTDGLYYNTDPLTQVSYKDNVTLATLATEAIDAYCHVEEVDLSKNQNISGIKLHRPFGKIRLLATDHLTDEVQQSEYPAKAAVDFKGVTVPASFDALHGLTLDKVLAAEAMEFSGINENALVNNVRYDDSYLIGYYYIFAADGSTSYAMDVTTYDQNGIQMGVRNLSQIPVQKNKLTTVIGNFYSNESTLEVIVEDPFKQPEIYINQALLDAAENGGEVTLDADCIFTADMPALVVAPGKTLTVNLNGHTIESQVKNQDAIKVNGGTLIVNGNGDIKATGDGSNYAVWAIGGSKVILNGGNYYGNGACIQAKDNAQIEINGGYYKVAAPYNGVYFVINLQDNQSNKIVVKGGKFENCDPSNTNTEPATVSDNFVADGYSSIKISDDPAVYEVIKGIGATDGQSLADAISSGEPVITLVSDITVSTPISVNDADADIEIDLNGKTINSPMSGDQDLITVSNGAVTLKNGTISTNSYGPVYGSIVANGTGVVIMEYVTYETSGVGFFAGQSGKIVVRNSNLTAGTYCVTSNATNPDQNITVILENSTLYGSDPVLLNVPSDITIDNCYLTGIMHGAVIRGGTAKIINSHITLTYEDGDYEEMADYFKNRNWGSGNMVNLAALTIGNKSASAYQYPTNVTLENTELILTGAHGEAFPALYAYANQGEGLGVTLNYNASCQFDGNLIYGSDNIVVNGTEVEPNEQ